jgi:hypothetical protein
MTRLSPTARELVEVLRQQPEDSVLAGAVYDSILESGASPLAARRRVNAVIREALAIRTWGRVRQLLANRSDLRAAVRRAAGAAIPNSVRVIVIDGDTPPTLVGEPPYHEFAGGGRCNYPRSAIRAGYRVVYVPDSREVRVGVDWLVAHESQLR